MLYFRSPDFLLVYLLSGNFPWEDMRALKRTQLVFDTIYATQETSALRNEYKFENY